MRESERDREKRGRGYIEKHICVWGREGGREAFCLGVRLIEA